MFKRLIVLLLLGLTIIQCEYPGRKDTILPTVVVIYPYADAIVSANSQVRVEASDDDKVKEVKYYLDGQPMGETQTKPFLMDLNVDGLKDGLTHRILATAEDPEGNIGTSAEISFIIAENDDVIDPTISILNPQAGQTVEGNVRIVALAEDERSIQKVAFFIDGDSVGMTASSPYNYVWDTVPFADSTNHTIFAKAFDGGNNTTTSAAVTVTVFPRTIPTDVTAPTVTILYPTTGSIVSGTVNIVANANDNIEVEKVEFYIDGNFISTDSDGSNGWSYGWNTAPNADGEAHIIIAKAYDTSGNSAFSTATSVTVTSTSDITPPTVTILYPATGSTISGTIDIVADVTDNIEVAKVEFYIDGKLLSTDTNGADSWSYSWNTSTYSSGQVHSIYLKAFDTSGNSAFSTATTVTVISTSDIVPPTVVVLYPTTGSTVSGTIDIVADVTDNVAVSKVEFYIDGKLLSTDTNGSDNWSYSWDTNAYRDGLNHTIYLKAYDPSNNVGSSGL